MGGATDFEKIKFEEKNLNFKNLRNIVPVSCVWEVELILKFKCQAAAALPKQHGESW